MTAVRIACVQPHVDTRPDGGSAIGHILVVLADDPGHRAMGLWLRTRHGLALWRVMDRAHGEPQARKFTVEGLALKLLGAAGGTVTGVDIDELGPNVLAAQVGVAGPAGHRVPTGTTTPSPPPRELPPWPPPSLSPTGTWPSARSFAPTTTTAPP
jgi:hypothetical protein